MDALGNFALHYDYLARALFTSSENVKKQLQRLVSKQVLSKRFPGTYGRPAGFQALTLRGDCQYRITFRPPVPPYSPPDPPLRGDRESPLPYRTPTPGAPAPTSGASPTLPGPGAGSEEEAADTDAAGRCAVDWWNREPPADDLDEPETGTDADRRRNQ